MSCDFPFLDILVSLDAHFQGLSEYHCLALFVSVIPELFAKTEKIACMIFLMPSDALHSELPEYAYIIVFGLVVIVLLTK